MEHALIKNRVAQLEHVEHPAGIKPVEVRFALNTIQGMTPQAAYRAALPVEKAVNKTNNQLSKEANKIKNRKVVQKYIQALNRELERVAVANGLDLQMFLSAAIFTPIGEIDEKHPLCQKKTVTVTTAKDGSTTEKTTLEMVSKSESVKTLIRMKGLDAPLKVDVNHNVGVMVVPMATNVDDWERAAMVKQAELMEEAVNID